MQVLNLAEELNKILNDDITTTIKMVVDNDEDLKALAIQEGFIWYKPEPNLPCFWATIKLGNVEFELEGVRKEIEVTYK